MMTFTEHSAHHAGGWVGDDFQSCVLMFQSIAGNTCGEGTATISPAGGLLLQCKTSPQLLLCWKCLVVWLQLDWIKELLS